MSLASSDGPTWTSSRAVSPIHAPPLLPHTPNRTPPESKYSHAAVWGLLPGSEKARRIAQLPPHRHGCQPREADARQARADAARRRRHLLPRDGSRIPRLAQQDQVCAFPWYGRRARFRGGSVADVGELVSAQADGMCLGTLNLDAQVLGAESAREDVEPFRDAETALA